MYEPLSNVFSSFGKQIFLIRTRSLLPTNGSLTQTKLGAFKILLLLRHNFYHLTDVFPIHRKKR